MSTLFTSIQPYLQVISAFHTKGDDDSLFEIILKLYGFNYQKFKF